MVARSEGEYNGCGNHTTHPYWAVVWQKVASTRPGSRADRDNVSVLAYQHTDTTILLLSCAGF